MDRKLFTAIKSLQLSIVTAVHEGLLFDAGLCSEGFGEYLLELGDEAQATF